MDLYKNKDKLIFGLILILALLIGYNIIYKLAIEKLNMLKSQIEEEGKKNEILKNLLAIDEKLQQYKNRSFSSTEITNLVENVSTLAKQAKIEIQDFDPQSPQDRKQYVELSLKIPFRCSYHRLGYFLSLIENSELFIFVKSLKVHRPVTLDSGEERIPEVTLILSGLYLAQ